MKKLFFTQVALVSFLLLFSFAGYSQTASIQAGDWSDAATWEGGVIPAGGDAVIINHHITVGSDRTIGMGTGVAILINNDGTLTLNQSVHLTVQGDIHAAGDMTIAAGGELWMDTEFPSVIQLTPGTTMAHLQINGTTAQHCSVKAIGNAHTRVADNDESGGGRIVATYCDFIRLGGDPDFRALQFIPPGSGEHYSFANCTFDQCSQTKVNDNKIFEVQPGSYIEFIDCIWTNSVVKTNLEQYEEWNIFETWSEYGATAKLIHCDFDKRVALHLSKDYEIEDCIFRDGFRRFTGIYWGGVLKSFKRNFIRWDGEGLEVGFEYGNSLIDCIFIIDNPDGWNPHFGRISQGTGPVLIDGCVFWWTGDASNAEGDGFFIFGATSGTREDNTITFQRNIFLPNAGGPDGVNNLTCTGFTILSESTNKRVVFKRNTIFTGKGIGGLNMGENYPTTAGDINYVKSNLFVGDINGDGMKMNDIGYTQQDAFLADSVDYNGGFHITDGSLYGNGSGKGYDNFSFSGSNIVGSHDKDDGNPLFVDPYRTLATWTPTGTLDATMDWLSPGGGHTMQELLAYIREGFRPQNAIFIAAGDPHDGSPDIGAVDITTTQNVPPLAILTTPPAGTTYLTGESISLSADASDADGTIVKVEFYADMTKLGEDATAPYSFTWTNPPLGLHELTAVAIDNDNGSGTSSAHTVLVTDLSQTKVVNDMGDSDDFSAPSEIFFDLYMWESDYNIPFENEEFIHQETADSFWVFTDAPAGQNPIKSRTIRMTANAEFLPLAIGQPETEIYLGIRYKDNMPTIYGDTPVSVWNGAGWTFLGNIVNDFDHQWKVAVFNVPVAQCSVENNRYRFKIGDGIWDDGLKGFLSIDRIELAVSQAELTAEADMPGYYPDPGAGNYTGLNYQSPWVDPSGNDFFPLGIAMGWTGMSEERFDITANAGFNTLVFYNWMDWADPYAAGDVWETLPSALHYGFSEVLEECADRNMYAIGVFQNDIKYFPVRNYFGNEAACVQYIRDKVASHKNHPNLLAWSQVDEPDHSGLPEFYAPLEWLMDLKKAIRQEDPNHPIFALEMGWRKGAFAYFKDIADYQGYDEYPDFGASLTSIADGITRYYFETENTKPLTMYLKSYERTVDQAYMSLGEAYISLIYGVNGLLYWDLNGADPILPVLTQINTEVVALQQVLLPPATFLDRNGMNSLCVDDKEEIHQALKAGADGNTYLLAVNAENTAVNNATFTLQGLESGTTIEVLFENRNITAGDGYFVDNFSGYGRHVYKVEGIILAVTYLSGLSGHLEKDYVVLNWTTTSETNNRSFEIEKQNHTGKWEKIGALNARGSTQEQTKYKYVDAEPYAGINYYRLKQIDNDGRFDYSNIASVFYPHESIHVYPNPAKDYIVVTTSENGIFDKIEMFNVAGERILDLNDCDGHIDVSGLVAGTYLLRVIKKGMVENRKIEIWR